MKSYNKECILGLSLCHLINKEANLGFFFVIQRGIMFYWISLKNIYQLPYYVIILVKKVISK